MRAALRLAFAAWVRRPRELALANAIFVLAVALPLPLLRFLPQGGLVLAGLGLWLAWAWMAFAVLCAACLRIHDGVLKPWDRAREWWRAQWAERLIAFAATVTALAWALAAATFWLRTPWPAWAVWPLTGISGGLALWLGLAALFSQAVAAEGGRGWRDIWRTSALLPLAYFPSALGAGAVFLLFSGVPALVGGTPHWVAALLLTPLLLGTFFTAAYAALFLGLLARSLVDQARGQAPPTLPSWRELWNPWQ